MVFVLTIGINTTKSKEKPSDCPCDCTELLADAVNDVLTISNCDLYGLWEAPEALNDDLKKLKNCCETLNKSFKSEFPDIVDGMLETIHKAIEGESYTSDAGATIIVTGPAPDCAMEALLNLQTLLVYGCPVQIIEF